MGNVARMGFKSRKMRPRSFRSLLWKTSMHQQHYRSLASSTSTHATVDAQSGAADTYLPLMDGIGSTNLGFWESGVQNPDEAVSAPASFSGYVILRGGVIKISIFNPSSTDSVGFRLFVISYIKNPDIALFPSSTTVFRSWDPSCIPDFARKVGKVIHTREGTIRVLSSSSVEYKLRVTKVDQATYRVVGAGPNTLVAGGQLGFILVLYNLSTGTPINCIVNTSRNLSFSGDANIV